MPSPQHDRLLTCIKLLTFPCILCMHGAPVSGLLAGITHGFLDNKHSSVVPTQDCTPKCAERHFLCVSRLLSTCSGCMNEYN